jgi:dTDP-4-amino-4,6-dideoxygalactose transaminase
MNNVNAAIGLLQMKYIDRLIDCHIHNGKCYDEYIKNPHVKLLRRPVNVESSYWIYSVLVENPKHFKAYLEKNKIASDVVHVRNDQYTVYQPFRCELPGVDFFASRLMHIPVGWWIGSSELEYIIDVVNKYDPNE